MMLTHRRGEVAFGISGLHRPPRAHQVGVLAKGRVLDDAPVLHDSDRRQPVRVKGDRRVGTVEAVEHIARLKRLHAHVAPSAPALGLAGGLCSGDEPKLFARCER